MIEWSKNYKCKPLSTELADKRYKRRFKNYGSK